MTNNIYSDLNNSLKDPFMSKLLEAGITPHDQRLTLYKYVTVETALAILNNCSVKFSSPLIFNDPFEMNMEIIDYNVSREELNNRLMKFAVSKNTKLPQRDLEKLRTKIEYEDLIEPYRKGLEIQKQQTLLFCTSKSFLKTLMWSHYADSHKGVCIGMKIPTIYPKYNMFTFNVNYIPSAKYLKILAGTEIERSIALYKWINTKSNEWHYEEEVRSCILDPNKIDAPKSLFSYVNIDASSFEEIYFGARIQIEDREAILNLIRKKNYVFNKIGNMKTSSSNKLIFNPIET